MRLLFTCGREPEYVRNHIIRRSLHHYVDAADIMEITDSHRKYSIRHLRLLYKFVRHFRRVQQHDVIFIGFYGFVLVYIVRLFSKKPLVFDAFLSTYNTLCHDRKVFAPDSVIGRLIYLFDKLACTMADIVVVDTRAHANYFMQLYGIAPAKIAVLYLGCDEEIFYPRRTPPDRPFVVFYYGSFLPLQGIEYIVRAAKMLEHERDIVFQIAGVGIQYQEIRTLADELGCTNIEFIGWIAFERLPDYIERASVCLGGHFAENPKARNVIATKTYQFLAMAKPTIVGQNEANAEIFTHGEHVWMCKLADPQSLVDAVRLLKSDPALRDKLAIGGYTRFSEYYSIHHISRAMQALIEQVHAPVHH